MNDCYQDVKRHLTSITIVSEDNHLCHGNTCSQLMHFKQNPSSSPLDLWNVLYVWLTLHSFCTIELQHQSKWSRFKAFCLISQLFLCGLCVLNSGGQPVLSRGSISPPLLTFFKIEFPLSVQCVFNYFNCLCRHVWWTQSRSSTCWWVEAEMLLGLRRRAVILWNWNNPWGLNTCFGYVLY